jgi:hypothetical protein
VVSVRQIIITTLQVRYLFSTTRTADDSGADGNAQKALELPTLAVLAKPTPTLVAFSEAPIIIPQAASAQRPVRKFCLYAPLSSTIGEKKRRARNKADIHILTILRRFWSNKQRRRLWSQTCLWSCRSQHRYRSLWRCCHKHQHHYRHWIWRIWRRCNQHHVGIR